jgi:hypothetical protein
MIRVVILCDTMIVVLASIISWYSFKLVNVLNHGFKVGWWTWLPVVLFFGTVIRFAILLNVLGYIPDDYIDVIGASAIIFWIGLSLFIYNLYKITAELVRCYPCKED